MGLEFALEAVGERSEAVTTLSGEIQSDFYELLWDSLGTVGQASILGLTVAGVIGGIIGFGRMLGKRAKD